jgi:hypothetical protein
VFEHHVEMHEFCLWCDFKSLKKTLVKSLKNFCEKILKKIVKIGVKVWIKKNDESLNLKMFENLLKGFLKVLK